jgi:hypothetical protein
MKKLVSIILILSLVIGSSSMIYAEGNQVINSEISQYNNGYFYTNNTDNYNVCIAANPDGVIDFNICYKNEPTIVYQQYISNDDIGHLDSNYESDLFWENVTKIGIENLSKSKEINVEGLKQQAELHPMLQNGTNSAESSLLAALRKQYGNEYTRKEIATTNKYAPLKASATQDLTYEINYMNRLTWVDAISIASFVAGLGFTSTAAKAIALALGAASVSTIFTRGTSVDYYDCLTRYTRMGCINGTGYIVYYKTIFTTGFEHEGKVGLDTSTDTIFDPSEYEYTDLLGLMKNAYDYYEAIH